MTRTLMRHTALRRFLSSWVAFAFVLSMTNVAFAVPVDQGAPSAPVVEQEVIPAEQPVEAAPEVVAPEEPAPSVQEPVDPVVEAPAPLAEVAPDVSPEASVVAHPVTADVKAKVASKSVGLKVAGTLAPAALVVPVEVGGNPALGAGGIRISDSQLPGTFTHTYLGIEIEFTVSVQETANGMEFSFVSDYPVTKVVAKGGNVGANIYTYTTPVLSDSGLHTPMNPSGKWADISHLDFYFAAPADLEAVKFHDLDADGIHDEGEPVLSGWTLKLRNAANAVVDEGVTDSEGSVMFENVVPGSYTVIETMQDDWVVTSDPYPVPVVLASGDDKMVHIGNLNVADVEVLKFEDRNADGVRDEGEPLLDGWTIRLLSDGEVVDSAVTADGKVTFSDVVPGEYTVDEVLTGGWFNTTELPMAITVVGGQDASYLIGNSHEDVVKTFELTYEGAPVGAEMFAVYQLVDGPEVEVELTEVEVGIYSADVELPYGSEIDSVTWIAVFEGVTYVLGSQVELGEVLTEDITNSYTYSASISGHKFGDEDANGVWDEGEVGLSGWTIGLYRANAELQIAALPLPEFGYELVAQTVTGVGGVYSFTGLLPGTYYVAEEMQDGWFMTVGPEGTFEIMNGSALTDVDFGNAEEGLPFTEFTFDKTVDREVAQPGDIVNYSLTYTLTSDSDPWTDPIPVIDDYDETYMTPVDVAGGTVSDGKITWIDNEGMEPGESRTIFYTLRVDSEMPEGETVIPNFALLDVQGGYDDDEDIVVTVDPFLPFTEFEFDKSANLSVAQPGDVVTYTLTYKLTAESDAWTDPIPVIDDYDERYMTPLEVGDGVVSDGKITWIDNEDMEPGETRTIVYTMRIDAEMPVGTTDIDNVALLDVQDGYEDEWTVRVSVEGEPFLPFTGGEWTLIVLAVAFAASAGLILRRAGQVTAS